MMARIILYMLTVILLLGCQKNPPAYSADDFDHTEEANITIAELREIYERSGVTTFSRDYVIRGVVTADDRSGNFYRTFFIDDGSGAVEVMAGGYDLYTLYPVGRGVSVRMKGATYGSRGGIGQIGLRGVAGSGYETDYFSHSAIMEKYISRGAMSAIPQGIVKAIHELTAAMAGRLVTLPGLVFRDGGMLTWGIRPSESYNGLPGNREAVAKDAAGDSVFIYTSGYADFAGEQIPEGIFSITGILTPKGRGFSLKLRDLNDVR